MIRLVACCGDMVMVQTFAGIFADGRQALAVSRGECRSYKDEFDDAIPGKVGTLFLDAILDSPW